MNAEVDHTVVRSGWKPGPWDSEPDKVNWVDQATGLDCMMVRNHVGAWCGYVGVPKGHPHYQVDYSGLLWEYDVHGGLTYSSECAGHICHTPEAGRPDDVWWLGFDCAHLGDLAPSTTKYPSLGFPADGKYRDQAYVREEVTSLALQISNAAE